MSLFEITKRIKELEDELEVFSKTREVLTYLFRTSNFKTAENCLLIMRKLEELGTNRTREIDKLIKEYNKISKEFNEEN